MSAAYLVVEVIATFVVALLLTQLAIPALSWLARRVSLVDVPDEHRKLHREPIPLVGGIAIFCSTLAALALLLVVRFGLLAEWSGWNPRFEFRHTDLIELGGLLTGALILLIVGILDDKYGLRGRQKLIGQLLACTILVLTGYQFDSIQFRGGLFSFGVTFGSFAAVAAYIWLLGAINSINLLDGADGFAGTIGAVMGVAFCIMALATGNPVDAAVFAAFTGAIIGFLRFNLPPAKVYLGDAGSMLIGFFFGALAIRCTFKQASAYAFLGPLALLSIPFLDTAAAIIRRRLTGRSIYSVDRAHLHHTLAGHGFGPRASLLLVGGLSSLTAAGGVLAVITRQSEYAIAAIALVIGFLLVNRLFGFAELKLIMAKMGTIFHSLKSIRSSATARNRHTAIQLQGRRDWQLIWQNVREFSEKYDFKTVKLHLHLPWLHEIYHARYDKAGADSASPEKEWYFVIPLYVAQRWVGEIEVVALKTIDLSPYDVMGQMMEMLADLEPQFVEIVESADEPDTLAKTVELAGASQETQRLRRSDSSRESSAGRLPALTRDNADDR